MSNINIEKENEDKIEKDFSLIENVEERFRKKKESLGGLFVSENDILKEATNYYKEYITLRDEIYKKREDKLKKENRDLRKTIEQYKPKAIVSDFTKSWLKEIKELKLHIYILKTKDMRYQCPYCNLFEEYGYIDQLQKLGNVIGLEEHKFKFKTWYCDNADRFLSAKDNPQYDIKIGFGGRQYFYAKGMGIQKFPAIDMWLYYNNKKNYEFYRIQGLGILLKKNENGELIEEIQFGELFESILKFLKSLDYHQLEMEIPQHKKGEIISDPLVDHIRKSKI